MNKKLLAIFLCSVVGLSFLQSGTGVNADRSEPIVGTPKLAVLIDGRKVKFEGGDPYAENGHVQVPLRGIGEALGAEIKFSDKTVTYSKDGKMIVLTLGSKVAAINDKNVTMDAAVKAVRGRTYVPLRFISENLGENVSWDQVGNWVWIGSKEVPTPEEAGIDGQSLDDFNTFFGTKTIYLDGKKDVHVFSEEDLPLKFKDSVSETIIYDVWKVKQGSKEGIRIRYSKLPMNIYYLTNTFQPRGRSAIEKITNSDKTQTWTFQTTSQIDSDIHKDKNYKDFNISQAKYIGFWSGTESIELLKNPFK
ncbi:copper amine oxidase N-terminal domain-containing protein [Paenibacillus oralis]|uniref:Copper amine oxidase N-terminal domain-containing protein n=1 Tax=Paenibacillus oralis TaxID=2490856 RepID=A0A3P3TWZ4_9BACL|nr:copper amine oxidase N-terminal domain-containing protein [Paenibacillus oralis]RRJ62226.1 copper amine oxidase N-terminal domain-containing protein [Paenibacillus oralis]